MEQNTNFLIETLYKVIKDGISHKDYNRVVEQKRIYTALITGEDMDFLMRRFDKHESEEMFSQRRRITSHITKSVAKNLMKPLYKVPRSNSAKRFIAYKEDSNSRKVRELEDILSHFWENNPLDSWFNNRWIDLNGTDPNAWCVLEWKDFDSIKEKAKPYPFEVSADQAIYFYRDDSGDVHFLVSKFSETDIFGKDDKDVYTIYGKNETIKFTTLTLDERRGRGELNTLKDGGIIEITLGDESYTVIKATGAKYFKIKVFTHDLGFVPAFRVGFKRDMATGGRTALSVIDDSVPILIKIVKANSEMDLTAALHVFPQKIQYAHRCDGQACTLGRLPDGGTCPKCGGIGYQVAKTAQDIIYLTMPKDKDDFLNLDNIVKYVSPSVELVQWQDRYIEKLTIRAKEAMYNTELFSKKEVAETATGKNIDLQNVYDSLYDMATAFSHKWKFAVESVAKIADMDEGLICFYTFSKDFKLKSLTDLYNDLSIVNNSNADSFVKSGINDDIAGIIFSEDPVGKAKYDTEKAFHPFNGKSEKEIMYALSTQSVPERVKVLYLNYSWIFDELFFETNDIEGISFYEMARDEQRKLIDKKIDGIIAALPKEPVVNDMLEG